VGVAQARAGRRRPFSSLLVALGLAGCDVDRVEFRPPIEEGAHAVWGAELYYKTIGVGEPLVVVHGGPGMEHSYLLPGLEPLGQTFRLILYDQRGLGRSTGDLDSASISMDRYVADLDAVRELAGVERVNLLAHSWGGLLALMYALEHPERLGALILMSPVEPGQRYAQETQARQQARRAPEDAAAIDSLVRTEGFERGDQEALNRLFHHVFRGTFAHPDDADSLRLAFTERTARQGRDVTALLMGPLENLDLWDELPQVMVPILVVHGDQDPIPVAMVTEMVDRLPDARLEVLSDVGHFPFIESPGPLFGAIQRFLDEQQPGARAPD
jgi:proline iminopeptidase